MGFNSGFKGLTCIVCGVTTRKVAKAVGSTARGDGRKWEWEKKWRGVRLWDSDYQCMRKCLRLRGTVIPGVGQWVAWLHGEVPLPDCFSLMESFNSLNPHNLHRKLLCTTNSCVTANLARRFVQINTSSVWQSSKVMSYQTSSSYVPRSVRFKMRFAMRSWP